MVEVLNTVSSGLKQWMGCTNIECNCFSLKHNSAKSGWPTNLSDQHRDSINILSNHLIYIQKAI